MFTAYLPEDLGVKPRVSCFRDGYLLRENAHIGALSYRQLY